MTTGGYMSNHFIYIVTNPSRSSLYIGMTSDLPRRVFEHKNKLVEGFTKKYNCVNLVYFESAPDRDAALSREKQLKGWSRIKKVTLINIGNPEWRDSSVDQL